MKFDATKLYRIRQHLVTSAGGNKRLANSVRNGVELIERGRCEVVNAETIRVRSTSRKVYLTSLDNCVVEETGETCQAFEVGVPCKHRAALRIIIYLNAERERERVHRCADCNVLYVLDELVPFDWHLTPRLAPGSTVPSGECPECGNYCYPTATRPAAA
jgi:hypothetical protein